MFRDEYDFGEWGGDTNGDTVFGSQSASQTDMFYDLITLLHRGGTGYIWQCSEARKRNSKPLRNGEWVWGDAAYKNTIWAQMGCLVAIPQVQRHNGMWLNTYFGVHPTNRVGESWQRSAKSPKAKSPHVIAANCVFAEFDAKDFDPELKRIADEYKAHLRAGGAIEDFDASGSRAALDRGMVLARRAVEAIPLKPTAQINSGGGLHAYWIYREPIILTDEATRDESDRLQKRFVEVVDSDGGAKDQARVLRAPGSHNHKGCYEDGPLPVVFEYLEQARLYTPEEIRVMCEELTTKPQMAWDAGPPAKPKRPKRAVTKQIQSNTQPSQPLSNTKDTQFAQRCLVALASEYVEEYGKWISVGIALYHGLGAVGLSLWDEWSKGGSSYAVGECERKWATFKTNSDKKLGLGTLAMWAGVTQQQEQLEKETQELRFEQIKAAIEKIEDKTELLSYLLKTLRDCVAFDTEQRETIYILLQKKLGRDDHRRWLSNVRQVQKEMEREAQQERQVKARERVADVTRKSAEAGRPVVNVSAPDLNDLTELCVKRLAESNSLYVYGGSLARVVGNQLQANLNEKALTYVLSSRLKFMERYKDGLQSTMPPIRLAGNILARGYWPEFPELKAISRIPFVTQDGRLVTEDGYDEQSGVYLKSNIEIGNVTPTPEAVIWAKEHINWILADYPFKREADKANVISFMILPFVKPFIRGITPMCLVDAPMRGTGKTHLMKMIYTAVSGDDLAVTNFNSLKGDEEIEKKIVGFLLNGSSHVLLDNLSGQLSSPVLEALLTSRSYAPRLLGGNHVPILPNNLIMLATGNNVELSQDMLSRTVFVRLDANMQDPTKRRFRNKHALELAQTKHRADTVSACLTLINKWMLDGMPQADITHRFPRWADVMGGVMASVEIDGFLENKDEMEAIKDPESEAWAALLMAWWAGFRDQAVTAGEVFLLASFRDATDKAPQEGENLLGGLTKEQGGLTSKTVTGRRTQLGYRLKERVDRVYGGLKIVYVGIDSKKRSQAYRLERV